MPPLANYQQVGEPKPGALTLLELKTPANTINSLCWSPKTMAAGARRYLPPGEAGAGKCCCRSGDKTHATFWQQLLRWLVADTPGQVMASTPQPMLSDEGRVPIRVEVRDKRLQPVTNATVQARIAGPDGASATVELAPQPLEPGVYTAEWTAEKPGSYIAEIVAGRAQQEVGRDVLVFRREDGVAENFHVAQNRELLEKLSDQTGGHYYPANDASAWRARFPIPKPASPRAKRKDLWDMPVVFLLRSCCAPPNGCCAGGGVWYEDSRPSSCCWPLRRLRATTFYRHGFRPGRRTGLRTALQHVGRRNRG